MYSFTQEDIVQYLYKETSPEKSALLQAALQSDWDLHEKYEVISEAIKSLEQLALSPRKRVVDYILKYGQRSAKEISTEV